MTSGISGLLKRLLISARIEIRGWRERIGKSAGADCGLSYPLFVCRGRHPYGFFLAPDLNPGDRDKRLLLTKQSQCSDRVTVPHGGRPDAGKDCKCVSGFAKFSRGETRP
jgi:hypothetical protein